ncbi:hypothetical protein E2562_026671 [Oryza meyeriana var. granulata]|uniref:DUF834 domain-containing protein n=1 Tax=Oryza meyeriana var. granulata TaxID=110450 RepID=A0A6G1C0X0_9ORYZ|nr:hypothetical protein E2562_026671 [Oryza meyeriana var. granulata]
MDGSEPRDLSMAQVWTATMVDERHNGSGVQPLRAVASVVRGRGTVRGGAAEGEESDQEELASQWLAQGVAERSAIERRGTGDRDLRWRRRLQARDFQRIPAAGSGRRGTGRVEVVVAGGRDGGCRRGISGGFRWRASGAGEQEGATVVVANGGGSGFRRGIFGSGRRGAEGAAPVVEGGSGGGSIR